MATKKQIQLKKCSKCGQEKKLTEDFYISYSPLHTLDKRVPVCKSCLRDMVNIDNIETIKNVLRMLDKPFIKSVWDSSLQEKKDTFGAYMKNIGMHQFRYLTWNDSDFGGNDTEDFSGSLDLSDDNEQSQESTKFVITPEMKLKWGNEKFTPYEYMMLEKFYDEMMMSHDISAPQHKKLLILMCKLNLKMDKCLEKDDINGFAKLHDQYQKLLQSSGFRPIDKTIADSLSGIRTFSQIFAEVEKDGFIKPVPITENQDIVDRTIQYILNYQIKLLNQQTLVEPPHDTPKVDDVDGNL